MSGRAFALAARAVVNATGPGCDAVRRMEAPDASPLLEPSRGTHLALDRNWTPGGDGLLIPKTSDGRVLFLLPWQGRTIAGTTDVAARPVADPAPSADEVEYLLAQLAEWLDPPPGKDDVLAAWAGLRPLIGSAAANTARIVREHHVEAGPKGLISIAGGKWTTYRLMAEEVVDRVVAVAKLSSRKPCTTRELVLAGGEDFDAACADDLAARHHLDRDIAEHLAGAYGTLADAVLAGGGTGGTRRLAPGHPYIEAEVGWARDHEMALTADDVLARRTRLAFLDARAAAAATPRVDALLKQRG